MFDAVEGDVYAARDVTLFVFGCASHIKQYRIFGALPFPYAFIDIGSSE